MSTAPTIYTRLVVSHAFTASNVSRSVTLFALKNIVLARFEVIENDFFFLSLPWIRIGGLLITVVFAYVVFGTATALPLTTDV